MANLKEIKIPSMGEGVIEASIIRWLVSEGSMVEQDTPLVEIATDKVDSEIFAPGTGKIRKILKKDGDIARVGETIALFQPEGSPDEAEIITLPPDEQTTKKETIILPSQPEPPPADYAADEKFFSSTEHGPGFYLSPFLRKVIQDLGIGLESLAPIKGTGHEGRITREDLYNFLRSRQQSSPDNSSAKIPARTTPIPEDREKPSVITPGGEDTEVVPMDRVRKIIARNMVKSKFTAPHVTSFYEADLTSLVNWRESCKKDFETKHGVPLTYTALFVEAVAQTLVQFPGINVSVEGETILKKKNINIGIATALPDGNLIVPVIHKANLLNLSGIAKRLNDLVTRARQGGLLPHETGGGTFTITNLGMAESLTGTPVINQPESAILAVGAIRRKPAVVLWEGRESVGIRSLCIFALSYDHRIIDGALGGKFLREVARMLEEVSPERPV